MLVEIRAVVEGDDSLALADAGEQASLLDLETRYGSSNRFDCSGYRASGRLILGFFELGDPVVGEAGLAFAPGWNAALESSLAWTGSRAWAAVTPRWRGRLLAAGVDFGGDPDSTDPLTWPGWRIPTGKAQVRSARLGDGNWELDLPRAMAGIQLGNWALNAGYAPRKTGVGVNGALAMDSGGKSFPAGTLRRTRPFTWSGPIRRLAPHDLLFRVGVLTEREVNYSTDWGPRSREARPCFFQWLLGWEVTPWLRFSMEHTAMAAAEDESLWLDLPQINFPLLGTTWSEYYSGPVTDRIFNVQLETRWRKAPWRVLPRPAGRLYWQYGGTDLNRKGPFRMIPELSIQALVAGFELVSPRWDLGLEYCELEDHSVLWYSNGGFPEGYSQDGWLLGHSLGGSGERTAGQVRYRPSGRAVETGLRLSCSTWGLKGRTPGTGRQESVILSCRRLADAAPSGDRHVRWRWEVSLEWLNEEADPKAFTEHIAAETTEERTWWRLTCKLPLN